VGKISSMLLHPEFYQSDSYSLIWIVADKAGVRQRFLECGRSNILMYVCMYVCMYYCNVIYAPAAGG
jgi:hypothetical protein